MVIILLIVLFAGAVYADDDTLLQKQQVMDKQQIIVLDPKTQLVSGIETIAVKPVNYRKEFTAYGRVITMQSLLELRQRFLLALTERNSAKAKFKQSGQNISRQQALYNNGISSKHTLQNQQAQWQIDKSQLDASRFQDQAIIDEALLRWGKVLSSWAFSVHNTNFEAFLSGDKKLLQITLPTDRQLPETIKSIAIEASGNRSKAIKAVLVSPAPQTDSSAQGTSYFFQTTDKSIRAGMNVTAWIPEQGSEQSGVIIPKSALIWSMGQAFVYIKTDDDKFSRRTINHYSTTAEGYFVDDALKTGEQLVIIGGQMLLSEELRGQIPDEDD